MKITAGFVIERALERHTDRVALRDVHGVETYAEVAAHIPRIGNGMRSFGIGPGDRVGLLSFNRREVVHAWLAFERAGVVRVALHSHFDFAEHVRLLTAVDAKALVFDTRFTPAVAEHRGRLGDLRYFAVGDDPPPWATPWQDVADAGDDRPVRVDVDENDPMVIQATTGTTGAPKPWVFTHRGWQTVVDQDLQYYNDFAPGAAPLGVEDAALHAHPLQWATAHLLYPLLMCGGRNVILDDEAFDAATVLDALVAERITTLILPAPMITVLLDLVEGSGRRPADLHRLSVFFGTPELFARITRLLGPIWSSVYTSTEQGALGTALSAHEAAVDPLLLTTIGRVVGPLIDMAVVDDAGGPVAPGRTGEIVTRSPITDSGYWRMPDVTAAAFFDGGWFRTGDLGQRDERGYLTYVDRAVDAIGTPDGTVYPHDVETAVLRHPAVVNCGVVGDGTRVVAAVLLKPGVVATPALVEEIAAAARPGLDEREVPEIIVRSSLPTVLGGAKVQRAVLRTELFGGDR